MNRTRQLIIGLGIMTAGTIALAVGAAAASHDLFVGLILLALVPLSASFCGAVVALIALARTPDDLTRYSPTRRIIGAASLAGLVCGFGLPALSILSQLPDYATGLNGSYLPVPGVSELIVIGTPLLVGLGCGILIALIRRTIRSRQTRPAGAPSPR